MSALRCTPVPLACLLALLPIARGEPAAGDARGNGPPALANRLGKVKLKQRDMIIAAAFAPDGKTVATGGWDRTICLWDAATGKELRQLQGHRTSVYGVAWSPDGTTLASGGEDKVIRLWDVAAAKVLRTLQGHDAGVVRMAFSADGKTLVSSSYDQTLRFWDVAAGKELRSFGGMERGFTSFAWSPDGKSIATGGADHFVRLLDPASGKTQRSFGGHEGNIVGVAYAPDGRLLATASEDQTVRLWDLGRGKEHRKLTGPDSGFWTVAFSPDGRVLAAGGRDKTIRLWDVVSGQLLRVADGHTDGVPTLEFSADGQSLLSCSHDTSAVIWEWANGAAPKRPSDPKLTEDDLIDLWGRLALKDAVRGQRAVWQLAAAPAQTLPYLHKYLRPVEPLKPEHLAKLVSDLDDEAFPVRQKASAALEKLGEQAEVALRRHMEKKLPLEVQQRVEKLLEKMERPDLPPDRVQALRGIEVLERIDTPESRQLLEKLAKGASGVRVTEEAKFVLARQARRAGSP